MRTKSLRTDRISAELRAEDGKAAARCARNASRPMEIGSLIRLSNNSRRAATASSAPFNQASAALQRCHSGRDGSRVMDRSAGRIEGIGCPIVRASSVVSSLCDPSGSPVSMVKKSFARSSPARPPRAVMPISELLNRDHLDPS